jgi:hypothetical protein
MIQQSLALQERQIRLFADSRDPEVKDCSLGDMYTKLKSDKQQEELFKSSRLTDNKFHVMMTIRAFAK